MKNLNFIATSLAEHFGISERFLWFVIVLTILAVLILYLFYKQLSKIAEETLPSKEVSSLAEGSDIDPGEYFTDRGNSHLMINRRNKVLTVRNLTEEEKKKKVRNNFDRLPLATSYPHVWELEDTKELLKLIPQLVRVNVVSTHELEIIKSPAAKFEDFEEKIYGFVFHKLNQVQSWRFEKQVVKVHKRSFKLEFIFTTKLKYMVDFPISQEGYFRGAVIVTTEDKSLLLTENREAIETINSYLPGVKTKLENYFPAGVQFIE